MTWTTPDSFSLDSPLKSFYLLYFSNFWFQMPHRNSILYMPYEKLNISLAWEIRSTSRQALEVLGPLASGILILHPIGFALQMGANGQSTNPGWVLRHTPVGVRGTLYPVTRQLGRMHQGRLHIQLDQAYDVRIPPNPTTYFYHF